MAQLGPRRNHHPHNRLRTQQEAATIAARHRSTTVRVPVVGDTTVEADETLEVPISSPVGATIADGTSIGTIGTIGNDDTASPSMPG